MKVTTRAFVSTPGAYRVEDPDGYVVARYIVGSRWSVEWAVITGKARERGYHDIGAVLAASDRGEYSVKVVH